MWGFPAFMTFEGKQLIFDDDAFRNNAVRLCQFYAAQGMAHAEKDVLELVQLTTTTAAVRTMDRMYRQMGPSS